MKTNSQGLSWRKILGANRAGWGTAVLILSVGTSMMFSSQTRADSESSPTGAVMQFTDLVVSPQVATGYPRVEGLSADGRYLLYSYMDRSSANTQDSRLIMRYDLKSGVESKVERVDLSGLSSLMTSDGRFVAIVFPWDNRKTGNSDSAVAELRDLNGGGAVVEPIFGLPRSMSDDGRFITYSGDETAGSVDDERREYLRFHVLDRRDGRQLTLERVGPPIASPVDYSGTSTTVLASRRLKFYSEPFVSADGQTLTSGWIPDLPAEVSRYGIVQYDSGSLAVRRTLEFGKGSSNFGVEILAVSRDGRFVAGRRTNRIDEIFWADMETGRYEIIPRVLVYPWMNQVRIADDGSWLLLSTPGDQTSTQGRGPSSDGSYDKYGYYRADITGTGVRVSGLSGISSMSPFWVSGFGGDGSVVSTGDGRVVIFSTAFIPQNAYISKSSLDPDLGRLSVGTMAAKKKVTRVHLVVGRRVRLSISAQKPATLTARQPLTARYLAARYKLKLASTSTISMKVSSTSSKYCRVSGSRLLAVRPGRCSVSVVVTPRKGRPSWIETNVIVKR